MAIPVIYADVVWLVNFVMDGVLLFTTCWIMHRRLRLRSLAAAACLGAMYSMLLFTPALQPLTGWAGKAVISVLMVWIAVPVRSPFDLARLTLLFYLITFVFAGAALAAHFALPGVSLASAAVANGQRLSFVVSLQGLALVAAIPVAAASLQFGVTKVRRARLDASQLARVRVAIGSAKAEFVGLLDSGNRLRDPLTRKPVCLVDASVLAALLPQPLAAVVGAGVPWWDQLAAVDTPDWSRRLCLIPFRGAGVAEQLTLGVRPDLVEIEIGDVFRPSAADCILALHTGKLSMEGQFQAILHIEVIAEYEGTKDAGGRTYSSNEVAH